jgi:Na+/H+ antiporter NhaD/arsenite permease-like protein
MNVPTDQRPVVLAIFVLTYVGLAVGRIPGLRLNRTGIALLGAIATMVVSGSSTAQTASSVSWSTIFLLFGFFVISAQLRLSGFYDWIAGGISQQLKAPTHFMLYLIVVTAALSAFLNNDIVCYVLTPVVAAALVKKAIDPVPFLMALAAASNIGGAATLIGNAQNMAIGTVGALSFPRYMLWSLVPVAIGLGATFLFARLLHRGGPPVLVAPDDSGAGASTSHPLDRYHAAKGIVILAAVIALFFTSVPREITVLVAAGIHLLSTKFRTEQLLGLVDWHVLLLFMSLFVISATFQATGYCEHLVQWMGNVGFDPRRPANDAVLTTGLSALIGNAPAVMLLIKLVPFTSVTSAYVMAVANSFAGNAILTASVANIIVVQQARQQGVVISFGAFARFGIPITVASVAGLIGWVALVGH